MRENLVPRVARLVDVYRAMRDAMLQGLGDTLDGTDGEISKPGGAAGSRRSGTTKGRS